MSDHLGQTERSGYLVRCGPPSKGNTIHRNDCPVLNRVKGNPLRWVFADKNPGLDWQARAPWLKACKVCKPPEVCP